ncbi:uncharacterized protein LOC106052641 isoform X2 [Biomphalaria glabrata]|uniref:Uncharacterized protein LOC106052641 isoform X2 n=1 Tax=Biomphalaria glabrata TaxID=6526 RepID=A0A2C9KZL9_BIOGL|nr:uncharacterized protein LOC106052641 isoform X2 [Biomphalaria glabrata]
MSSKDFQPSQADQAASVSTEESKANHKEQESYRNLQKLVLTFEQFDRETNEDTCRNVLINIFQFGKKVENLNIEDKIKIAKVLENKASFLYNFLFKFGFNFDPTYSLLLLKYRSALEFLISYYGSFPLDEDEKALKRILINLENEINPTDALDEAIRFLKESLFQTIEPEGFTFENLHLPPHVSKKHSWWYTDED